MKKLLLLAAVLIALACAGLWDGPLGASRAAAAVAPVVCANCDGGGAKPACTWAILGMYYGSQRCWLASGDTSPQWH